MKLLYDRVLIRKSVKTEWAEGILAHHLSDKVADGTVSEGVVVCVGEECQELEVGMRVAYPTKIEKTLLVNGEDLVDLRESMILGVLENEVKLM